MAARLQLKTFICALPGAFHNTFYEQLFGGDAISIRVGCIHKQN